MYNSERPVACVTAPTRTRTAGACFRRSGALLAAVLLVPQSRLSAATATNYVGLNFGADFATMASADSAGAVAAFANWNNIVGANTPVAGLHDSEGAATSITLTRSGFENQYMDYGRTSAANGDERMVWACLDNNNVDASRSATLTVSEIAAEAFDVYVYVGSDNPNRRGTVGIAGRETYSYKTVNAEASFPISHVQTTDTGTNYPYASYAVWSNLTGSGFVLTLTAATGGENYASGLNGMQIVLQNVLTPTRTGACLSAR